MLSVFLPWRLLLGNTLMSLPPSLPLLTSPWYQIIGPRESLAHVCVLTWEVPRLVSGQTIIKIPRYLSVNPQYMNEWKDVNDEVWFTFHPIKQIFSLSFDTGIQMRFWYTVYKLLQCFEAKNELGKVSVVSKSQWCWPPISSFQCPELALSHPRVSGHQVWNRYFEPQCSYPKIVAFVIWGFFF